MKEPTEGITIAQEFVVAFFIWVIIALLGPKEWKQLSGVYLTIQSTRHRKGNDVQGKL
ncbi:MAG TPA: hypothetical protein VFV52_18375 [Bacilli bacterium]|nr:hypothetical protein [Bacilli bacterium]